VWHDSRELASRAVTKVGVELDRELAALLQGLDVNVPEALLRS
jgi:hypothetical protein